jgi:hypothetical protein
MSPNFDGAICGPVRTPARLQRLCCGSSPSRRPGGVYNPARAGDGHLSSVVSGNCQTPSSVAIAAPPGPVPGEFLFTAQVRFVKTSIAADILGFEVSRAKQFIRPGQMLR